MKNEGKTDLIKTLWGRGKDLIFTLKDGNTWYI